MINKIKLQKPLIHCITNPISINQCANAVLALGAKPIMAEHPCEVSEITKTADAKSGRKVVIEGSDVIEITELEMRSAKESLCSSLRATHDSPGSIENYYATAALSGLALTPEAYLTAVEAVTVEQVTEAAKSLSLHTVFFLKGVTQ